MIIRIIGINRSPGEILFSNLFCLTCKLGISILPSRAVKDCDYVIHVASPFPNAAPKSEDEVVIPAVEGTKNVLEACAKSGTVKRVVITSSVVAIYCMLETFFCFCCHW